MIPETLVDEYINKRIDAGIEGDNDNADDIGDVAVLLAFMEVIQHVDDQHWKPRDTVHSADLETKTNSSRKTTRKHVQSVLTCNLHATSTCNPTDATSFPDSLFFLPPEERL